LGGVGPEGGGHFRGVPTPVFQVLDQIEQLIHWFVLSGWAMLTDKYMDRRAWMDARQNAADVANGQRFDDCQGAMLAVG
jgi:spore germination cell wall hydrolase CwlJ-like protein